MSTITGVPADAQAGIQTALNIGAYFAQQGNQISQYFKMKQGWQVPVPPAPVVQPPVEPTVNPAPSPPPNQICSTGPIVICQKIPPQPTPQPTPPAPNPPAPNPPPNPSNPTNPPNTNPSGNSPPLTCQQIYDAIKAGGLSDQQRIALIMQARQVCNQWCTQPTPVIPTPQPVDNNPVDQFVTPALKTVLVTWPESAAVQHPIWATVAGGLGILIVDAARNFLLPSTNGSRTAHLIELPIGAYGGLLVNGIVTYAITDVSALIHRIGDYFVHPTDFIYDLHSIFGENKPVVTSPYTSIPGMCPPTSGV